MSEKNSTVGSALISSCGTYRYSLVRNLGEGRGGRMLFCMLNPSTADAATDDPTIRRCIGFARREGFSSLEVWNLYALRATKPTALWEHPEPVGPENDAQLKVALSRSHVVVLAWGSNARADRVADVWPALQNHAPLCIGTTKRGAPRHPLYLRRDAPFRAWSPLI